MSEDTTSLKRALLTAVEEGRLAVEELLDAAFAACGEDDVRLEPLRELASAAEDKPKRRVYVKRPPPLQGPHWDDALAQAREQLMAHPDVEAVGWGRTFSEGTANDEVGVIARVRAKQEVDRARAIPRHVDVKLGNQAYRLRVDVRELGALTKQASVSVNQGAPVRAGGRRGTLSAVVSDNGRHRALLSGHVAGGEGTPVEFRSLGGNVVRGIVRWHRDNEELDGAAVPDLSDIDAALLGRSAAELISESEALEGLVVTIHGAETRKDVKATIVDASADVTFAAEHKPIRMQGLLELDAAASIGGDSGAPALDSRGKLVGFVVGRDERGRTHLILARKVIDASR